MFCGLLLPCCRIERGEVFLLLSLLSDEWGWGRSQKSELSGLIPIAIMEDVVCGGVRLTFDPDECSPSPFHLSLPSIPLSPLRPSLPPPSVPPSLPPSLLPSLPPSLLPSLPPSLPPYIDA